MKQLDSRGETILKYIGSHNPTTFKALHQRFPRLSEKDLKGIIDILEKKKFVNLPNSDRLFYGRITLDDLEVSITYAGQLYLENLSYRSEERRFARFHTWANTIIAILAFLTAIPALILSVMQLLQR